MTRVLAERSNEMPLNQLKPCACTGVRWCAKCRGNEVRMRFRMDDPVPIPTFLSDRTLAPKTASDASIHFFDPSTQSAASYPAFEGVRLYRDFLSEPEAERLLEMLEATPFTPAQSGKRKQHYGPKINFNKQKMNPNAFQGIPAYAHDLESRMRIRVRDEPALPARERAAAAKRRSDKWSIDAVAARYANLYEQIGNRDQP